MDKLASLKELVEQFESGLISEHEFWMAAVVLADQNYRNTM
jgi:uncharacterized protein YqgQ